MCVDSHWTRDDLQKDVKETGHNQPTHADSASAASIEKSTPITTTPVSPQRATITHPEVKINTQPPTPLRYRDNYIHRNRNLVSLLCRAFCSRGCAESRPSGSDLHTGRMISWQASVAGDGKRVAAVCFGGCFQHFTASPTSSPTSSSSSSLPSFSSSSSFASSSNSAVANLVTDSYDFTLSGPYCRRQGRRTTVPLTSSSPHSTAATTLTANRGPHMVVPEENACWRSDGRYTAACGGGGSVNVDSSGVSVAGVEGLPRQHELSPFATTQVDHSLQHQQQHTNSHPFQENFSFESLSSSSAGCCSPSRSGTVVGADSSSPQRQSGADFLLSRPSSVLLRGEEGEEKDCLSSASSSSSFSFPQWLGRRSTTSGEVRFPLLPGSPLLHQHHQASASPHQPLRSSCLAASASSSSAAADRGGKDSVVPMVALECELPRSGRLSPPGADVAFTFLPSAVSSSSSPSSSPSSGRNGEDSATTAAAAAAVADSMYCPGTMLPPPMPSLRSAVSSSSDSSSNSCSATESGGLEGQSIYCPSVVSSSPFSQTVSSTNSSSGGTNACLNGNPALLAAADSPHSHVTLADSPCLQAPSGSNLGGDERPSTQCPVAMSASPMTPTFCSSSNSSDISDLSALQQQHQHRSLLESPQHIFPSSSCSSSSTSSACSSRAGCKRRFSHHLTGEEEVDADCNRVRVNGLDVEDMLNVESSSSAVTCGRCGEECGGGGDEEGNPSKRRKLLHEDVVGNVFVETSETNVTLMGDEEMTHFSVETVDVVTASDDDDHIPRAGSSSTSAVSAVSEDESVTVVVEASGSFDVVEQSLRDSVLEDEADSIAEVDVVGHDSTTDDPSTHFHNHPQNFHHHHLHYQHHSNALSLHHQQPSLDIAMDQRSMEEDNAALQQHQLQHVEEEGEVEPAATTVVTTEEAMEQQQSNCIGAVVGDCENSSEDGENDHEQDHDNNNDSSNANGEDADDDDEDDDSAFFYPAHRSQRISPFLNTPKQRKEERRKILKLSIHKMRAVEDPEHFLRRSVLINNTMKRLQRELREEKMRNSPRRGCYGLYRRASALHYDVLNNSYLLHDEPFAAVSENDRITDDMTDALVTRLEATTSSPIVVPTPSPSPSPSPSPADEPDTSSAAFPTTSLSLSCTSSSSSSLAASSTVSPLETPASCSLDITSTVGESSSPTMSAFSEAGPSSSCSSMSEELVIHTSHHHHHHHHLQFHHQHHHQQQHHHSHEHDESGPVPDLMPSLDDDEVESEVSEALSTTTITSPVTASLSVSDLSSTVSSLASSSSPLPPSCSSSNLSSASSPSMMYDGVFGVPSVVREAQSSGASCSSESQREKQLYADIDTVFNLIHALGDS